MRKSFKDRYDSGGNSGRARREKGKMGQDDAAMTPQREREANLRAIMDAAIKRHYEAHRAFQRLPHDDCDTCDIARTACALLGDKRCQVTYAIEVYDDK